MASPFAPGTSFGPPRHRGRPATSGVMAPRELLRLRRENSVKGLAVRRSSAADEDQGLSLFSTSFFWGRDYRGESTASVSDQSAGDSEDGETDAESVVVDERTVSSGDTSRKQSRVRFSAVKTPKNADAPTMNHEDTEDPHHEVVKWWKNKGTLDHIWQQVSVSRALHEVTIVGDFVFERYAHFWQLLRNVHFSKYLPAVLITRIFFRGVYLLAVGVKKNDYHPWEWKIRVGIRRGFNVERQESLFYDFYIDVLIEIIFIALISKANNATFNRALAVRLRNWQWLILGMIALYVCVLRDMRLTQFDLDPSTLNRKTKFIIHTIGTLILTLCDMILVGTFVYIITIELVLGVHDIEIFRSIASHDDQQRQIGAVGGTSPGARHMEAEIKNAEIVTNSCDSCLPLKKTNTATQKKKKKSRLLSSTSDDDGLLTEAQRESRARRAEARRRREVRKERIIRRARTAARNFRFAMLERRFAPEYVFREADQRALLAAMLHPPGACEGRFQAHDLVLEYEKRRFGAAPTAVASRQSEMPRSLNSSSSKNLDETRGGIRGAMRLLGEAMRKPVLEDSERQSAARMAQRTARTITNDIFGGLWAPPTNNAYFGGKVLTPAQKRAMRLKRLHLCEKVEVEWQERVRNRTYDANARLLMSVVMGWLLAVAATAGLAYGAYALEKYIDRRLGWLEDTIDDVDELLRSYLTDGNRTFEASEELLESLTAQVDSELDSVADSVVESVSETVVTAIEDSAAELNVTDPLRALNETIAKAVSQATNVTLVAISLFEQDASRQLANIILEYFDRYYGYVEDYRDVLNHWVGLARRASSNVFQAGLFGAVVAFILMNYSLLMIMARYRETTHRFRETGMIDDMDLIFDESMQEPASRSEWFWIIMTAPSAPYAVAFVGNAVSNMLIISIMTVLILFVVVGISLFPGAVSYAGNIVVTHVGSWVFIYPVVYCIDWFYLNAFIADRTYIIHRSCFDMWDFLIGMWKLVTGLFGGVIRITLIYLIATANTIRIDWTIFGGRIGWLDIGYNSFASAVMLTERHDNPLLCGSSRLILSSASEPYARRTCAEHVLTFDIVAPSRVLDAANGARNLPDLFERVIMEDPEALAKAQRARVALAWRTLHLMWILVSNPSLVTWNVKKWRENPISDAIWRRAREKIRKRRDRDRKKRRARAILEFADRELNNAQECINKGTAPATARGAESPRTFFGGYYSHRGTRSANSPSTQRASAYSKATALVHYALGNTRQGVGRRQRASVIDRIDRLESLLDDRLPGGGGVDASDDDDARLAPKPPAGEEASPFSSSSREENKSATTVALSGARDAGPAPRKLESNDASEKDAIVAEPGEIADVLTRFQLGYLRTTFRLLDKDQDELVSTDDLQFHYKSQGNVLTSEEAKAIIDAVSVTRKGYYVVHNADHAQPKGSLRHAPGDLREVERFGFDFPEFLAYALWRLSTEEGNAIDFGVASGLTLNQTARDAVLETMFVRFKGLDERIVNVEEHISPPLVWPQLRTLVRRTRLDRGPFGIRKLEARLLFDLLALGVRGGNFEEGIEADVSRECGPFFAQNARSIKDNTRVEFPEFAAFFDASIYAQSLRITDKDIKDNVTDTSSVASATALGDAAHNPNETDDLLSTAEERRPTTTTTSRVADEAKNNSSSRMPIIICCSNADRRDERIARVGVDDPERPGDPRPPPPRPRGESLQDRATEEPFSDDVTDDDDTGGTISCENSITPPIINTKAMENMWRQVTNTTYLPEEARDAEKIADAV
ncbi:hypothetical protein CTAYLR_003911 [Chrysophaeum taylorii]|uniref:EF-hand domain-containing protein n=1 Tax=Chrysophaeum taylorii TaxID=2483200 RepID=A0AAD7XJR8_9STRA|nr:hypothetical protein CTAYLR_003911 [Chrysophaeum taylorii]